MTIEEAANAAIGAYVAAHGSLTSQEAMMFKVGFCDGALHGLKVAQKTVNDALAPKGSQ